jgi:hypothetical protein
MTDAAEGRRFGPLPGGYHEVPYPPGCHHALEHRRTDHEHHDGLRGLGPRPRRRRRLPGPACTPARPGAAGRGDRRRPRRGDRGERPLRAGVLPPAAPPAAFPDRALRLHRLRAGGSIHRGPRHRRLDPGRPRNRGGGRCRRRRLQPGAQPGDARSLGVGACAQSDCGPTIALRRGQLAGFRRLPAACP